MKILVHDYSGHPFQIQLSRALAGRGHDVHHVYSASFQTPKGPLAQRPSDPAALAIRGLQLRGEFAKYSFVRRARQEHDYARLLLDVIDAYRPEVVLSGNAPPLVQYTAARVCRRRGIRFAFWVQDLYGVAIRRLIGRRWAGAGGVVAAAFERLERRALRDSTNVIAITRDFLPVFSEWSIPSEITSVIPNWAPVDELPPVPKVNPWSQRMGLAERPCVLYSGTLGLKHNASMFVAMAERLPADHMVVVVSQGLGADELERERTRRRLENLRVLGFQPFEELPSVLATADVLVATLEADAATYSVPSKVLTYLCAGRPLLLGVPEDNLAARIVRENGAGIVVAPADVDAWCTEAQRLLADEPLRRRMAANARAYAEREFDIGRIAERFEAVLAA
jgi:colanic acid biosynthesis glycosyl transferase WcaI